MDGSSAAFSQSNPTAGGASKFLANLPSRGLFSSTVPSSNPGGMRVYTCDHDTSPPEDQLIKTNQMNILIRSLVLKNQKGRNEGSRKRAAEKVLDGRASAKRAVSNTQQDLKCLTVEKLRALLKEKGLSVKGKKDELIARLRS